MEEDDLLTTEPTLEGIFPLIYDDKNISYFYKICFTNEKLNKQEFLDYFNPLDLSVKCYIAQNIDQVNAKYLLNTKYSCIKIILIGRWSLKEELLLQDEEIIKTLINDPDYMIRRALTNDENYSYNLKIKYKELWKQLINDKDDMVRCNIASSYLESSELYLMMNDSNKEVRYQVARGIEKTYLIKMIYDESRLVRFMVANRINPIYLPLMFNDGDKCNLYYIKTRYRDEVPFLKRLERIIFSPKKDK